MKILFLTIVLDGLPWIANHYPMMRSLPFEWEWHVVEGVAENRHCTSWVKKISPRISQDGTTQYLNSLKFDPRVHVYQKPIWNGKIEMVNAPLMDLKEPVLLWQIDSDEIWKAIQIDRCRMMFIKHQEKNSAFFWCRYFVGPDKVITTRNGFGNHPAYEWQRVWKIKPGMMFKTHEPPEIGGLNLNPFTHDETEVRGLVFDHMAYVTRQQVEFKEKYYAGENNPNAKNYSGLTNRWEKFQRETIWPRKLKEVMPWAEQNCMVDNV